ncbi:MAG: aldo/keto reductase [Nitrospinota bacterium]|nr:aldo/keto reductase [Nitrospinota bacterium]
MKYRLLGKSGLRVSEICLGAMTFGKEWAFGTDKEESRGVFDTFTKAGGNFIDTANKYHEGTSEKWLAEFISSDRERLVLATKYTLIMRPGDINSGGNHRKNMVESVNASLKRLKTDYIDLYWLHMWDYTTPIEEVMRGLDDLVRAGKIHYIGASDTPAWIVSRANMLAELRGWTPFTALQLKYNLMERTIERELLPMAKELDIAVTAWGPMNYGLLSGKYSVKDGKLVSTDGSKRYTEDQASIMDERRLKILGTLQVVAKESGRSMAQVALNWVKSKGAIPIVGAKTDKQMRENLEAFDFTLDDTHMEKLETASRIELGFPHDFLKTSGVMSRIFGDNVNNLETHR